MAFPLRLQEENFSPLHFTLLEQLPSITVDLSFLKLSIELAPDLYLEDKKGLPHCWSVCLLGRLPGFTLGVYGLISYHDTILSIFQS